MFSPFLREKARREPGSSAGANTHNPTVFSLSVDRRTDLVGDSPSQSDLWKMWLSSLRKVTTTKYYPHKGYRSTDHPSLACELRMVVSFCVALQGARRLRWGSWNSCLATRSR